MPENCEQLKWQPILSDCDLLMYLRAARSVSTFAGMCDGGSVGDGCVSASRDETTINALELLHEHEYNTSKALQALVLKPLPKGTDKKWTDDEQKRFIKGLRQYGKDFFKIKQELLSHKETSELVEYYYLWKKTPSAANARPRRHRRPFSIRRNTANNSYPQNSNNGSKNSNPIASAQLEFSSSSDEEGEESEEDSDSTVGQATICQHCLTTTAKDFQPCGKDNGLLCTECRLYYKKNGEYRPLDNLTTTTNNSNSLTSTTVTDANGSKVQTRRSKDSKDNNGSFKLKKDNSLEPNSPNSPINVDTSLSESNEQKLTSDLNPSIKSSKLVNDSPKKGKKHKIVNDDKLNNKKVKTEDGDEESTDNQLNSLKDGSIDDSQQATKDDDLEIDIKLTDNDKLTELNEATSLIDKKDDDNLSKESGSLNDNQDKLNSNNQESISKESSISNDNNPEILASKKESNQLSSSGSPAKEPSEQTVNNLDKAEESNSQINKINDDLTNSNSSVQTKDNINQLILSEESNKSITNQDSQLSTAASIKKEIVDDNGANKSEFNRSNDNQQPSIVNDESKLVPKIESNSSFANAINSDSNSSITQPQMNPQQTTATITTSATTTPINNLPPTPSLPDSLNQFSPFNLPGLDKNLLNQLPPGHHPFLHLTDPANSSAAAAAAAASGLPPGFPPGLPYQQLSYLNPSLFGRGLPPGFHPIPPNFPPTSLASEQQRQQSANNSSSLNNSASNSNLPNNNQQQPSASAKQQPRSSPVTNLNRNHLQPTPEQQQQAVNAALQSQLQHPFGLNPMFPHLSPQQMAHHHFLTQSFAAAQHAKRFMQQQQQQNANQSSDYDQDSDEIPIYRGPSPKVRIDDKELLRSKSAIFIRHLYRGDYSSCSRTDLTYKPAQDSQFVIKKAERQRKQMEKEREEQKKIAQEKQQQLQQQQHLEQQKQQMEQMAQLALAERQHRMNAEYAAQLSAAAANRPNAPPFSPGFRNAAGLTPNPPNLNAANQSNPGNQSMNLPGSQSQQPGSNNNNSLQGIPGFPPGYSFPGVPGQMVDPLLLQLEFQKLAKEHEEREKKERIELMEKRENDFRKFAALAAGQLPNPQINPYDPQFLELQRRYASLGFPQQAPNHQLPSSTQSLPNSLQQHQHQNTTASLPGSMPNSSAIYSAAERERFGLHAGLNALSSHSNSSHPNNANNSTSAAETLHSLSTDRLQSERLAALGNINNEHLARLQMINAAAASNASNLIPPTSTPNSVDLHNAAAQHNHPLHQFNPGSLPGLPTSQSQGAPGMPQTSHPSMVGQNQASSLESQLHHNLTHPGLLPGMMNPALARAPNPGLFRPELNMPNAAGLLRPNYDELTQQLMLKHHSNLYSR